MLSLARDGCFYAKKSQMRVPRWFWAEEETRRCPSGTRKDIISCEISPNAWHFFFAFAQDVRCVQWREVVVFFALMMVRIGGRRGGHHCFALAPASSAPFPFLCVGSFALSSSFALTCSSSS